MFKLALLLLTLNAPVAARAQSTAFTYQGSLTAGGSPVTGSYDLIFSLFDTNFGGAAIAGPATNDATLVSNGLFTATIDFGPGIFNGGSYWLEIGVQTNGGGGFTTLAPRQPITPTPSALYSATAGSAASATSVAATNISGVVQLTQLPAAVVTNGAVGVNIGGSFSGNGAGLTNFPAASIAGLITTPILQPTWDATGTNIVADAAKDSVEFTVTNNLSFAYATNGVPGAQALRSIYLYGASSNVSVVFPTNWLFFNCTATNTILANEWTAIHFRFKGATDSAANQTNVMVKLESQ